MFLKPDKNTAAIEELFEKSATMRCAVAFLGEKALDILANSKANIQLVCNFDSGVTNPNAVEKLRSLNNIEVRNQSLLHAKVYRSEDAAIITSANISANGLGLEDAEVASWLEAGYKVTKPEELEEIDEWLDGQWEAAKPITKKDIKQAKMQWKKRRNGRPAKPRRGSLLDELRDNPEFFKDKEIYFTITRAARSDEADELLEELRFEDGSGKELDAYEDWSELPGDAYFIDLYFGPRSGFEIEGLFHSNGKNVVTKGDVSLFLCHKVNSIYGLELSDSDQKLLRKKIAVLNGANKDGSLLSMEEARERLFG